MGEGAGQVTGWDGRPGDDELTAADDPTGDPEVDQLVVEIEETRVEMTSTVEEIGDRLDPKNIMAGAKETVREATVGKVEQMANSAGEMVSNAGQTAQEAGTGLIDTIKKNPIPAAMAGIGLGLLAKAARSEQGSRRSGMGYSGAQNAGGQYGQPGYYGGGQYGQPGQYGGGQYGGWDTGSMGSGPGVGQQVGEKLGQVGSTAGSVAGSVGQTAGNVAGTVGQTAGNVASTVGQTAGDVVGNVQQTAGQVASTVGQTAGQGAQQVQSVARQVGDTAGRAFKDNPLAIGAIAVAVGTAVGMALPATRAERKVLGQARDQVIDKAEMAATDALSQVEDQAREVEDKARQQDMEAKQS